MATRKNGKKFSCSAFMKHVLKTMKKKNPRRTMKDVERRLKQMEASIADSTSTF